jgi:hypothetical protein
MQCFTGRQDLYETDFDKFTCIINSHYVYVVNSLPKLLSRPNHTAIDVLHKLETRQVPRANE